MRQVMVGDLLSLMEYQSARDRIRDEIIAYKKHRRVQLGDLVSIVFENHRTLWFQTQEMLRAEHISDPRAVAEELEVYNEMLPPYPALAATLLIEIPDQSQIPAVLKRLTGLEEEVTLWLDETPVHAEAEPGRSKEDKTSSVHYLTFPLTAEQASLLKRPETVVRVAITHPGYEVSAVLDELTHQSLASDLDEDDGAV